MIKNIKVNNVINNNYKIHNYQSAYTDYEQVNLLEQELQKYFMSKYSDELRSKNLEDYKIKEIANEWVKNILSFYQEQYTNLNPVIIKYKKRNKCI